MILKGVRRYPKILKAVHPTKHKYGADVTWSAHTDTYKPNLTGHGVDFEINAFKNNLQGTILLNHQTDGQYEEDIKAVLKTGRLSSGQYFRAAQDDYQRQVDWYNDVTNKHASYWSYANGNRQKDDFVLREGLISRISEGGEIDYDFDTRLSHPCATIFNYDIRDYGQETALQMASDMLQNAIDSGGWYNDFSHWHWAEVHGNKNQLELFLSQQKSMLNNVNYVTLGAGEAVEYMWLRKQFKRGGLYRDGDDLVLICDVWNEEDLPYKTIDTSLSVEIDLSGTILAGKDITSNTEIMKTGTDTFIIQVPYRISDGFRTVRIKESSTPHYSDFSAPIITSSVIDGSILNVATDKPTKAVVFAVPSGGSLYQAEIVSRSNERSTTHTIDIGDRTGKDVYIGVITKENQSVLSSPL